MSQRLLRRDKIINRMAPAGTKLQVPPASQRTQEEGGKAGWVDVIGAPQGV